VLCKVSLQSYDIMPLKSLLSIIITIIITFHLAMTVYLKQEAKWPLRRGIVPYLSALEV